MLQEIAYLIILNNIVLKINDLLSIRIKHILNMSQVKFFIKLNNLKFKIQKETKLGKQNIVETIYYI